MRQHAQRKHIIRSLDRICYQLFATSFFLSPSLLQLVARSVSQFQFSRPRDLDAEKSLKFWLFIVMCANMGSLLNHTLSYRVATPNGEGWGKTMLLDFVGMGTPPTQIELLALDVLIIFLQVILVCISYETSLAMSLPPEALDPLAPDDDDSIPVLDEDEDSESTPLTKPPPPSQRPVRTSTNTQSRSTTSTPVLHLRLRPTIRRILDPAPPISSSNASQLPLPNTTPTFVFPSSSFPIQIAFRTRTRGQVRRDPVAEQSGNDQDPGTGRDGEGDSGIGGRGRTIPGGLDVG
ncbi:hypothetical protein M422DRAFT_781033 [Sphaerobolus stellatus SS14]|uniref:Unplaced genomic scaffold SPHSTscaffold_77, whole genome shotgun sequence n=1 Tax=Sphaerobolus stellatus (strain SS14) TaxID=990650 RepID=A0A0C9VN84_SPHS4|nr:hypothetical protein M422DRAFT_781033 [Sphaerobolus stellatus SS14]